MTIGDIIEKIRVLFGLEPAKTRKLRERTSAVMEQIRNMEDGLRDVRRQVSGVEDRLSQLKDELKLEKSTHNQDLIMDEMDTLKKEFDRKQHLANLKRANVDAARTLRAKLEELMESALNGGNVAELESVLDKVEDMGADMSDICNLVKKIEEKSGKVRPNARDAEYAKTDAERAERAERRARLLGECMDANSGALGSSDAVPSVGGRVAEPVTVSPSEPAAATVSESVRCAVPEKVADTPSAPVSGSVSSPAVPEAETVVSAADLQVLPAN